MVQQDKSSKARENFVRLAESRTNRVLKDLELLGNLSNRSNYSYTEEDVKKIIGAVKRKVHEIEGRFDTNLRTQKNDNFKL